MVIGKDTSISKSIDPSKQTTIITPFQYLRTYSAVVFQNAMYLVGGDLGVLEFYEFDFGN